MNRTNYLEATIPSWAKHPAKGLRLKRAVRGDWPIGHRLVAEARVYEPHEIYLNPLGAVSVLAKCGEWLGIRPSEMEWLEERIATMQPHEERVVREKRELDEKLAKLKAFCFDPVSPVFSSLPPRDRDLLEEQYTAMSTYSEILGKRIARFE